MVSAFPNAQGARRNSAAVAASWEKNLARVFELVAIQFRVRLKTPESVGLERDREWPVCGSGYSGTSAVVRNSRERASARQFARSVGDAEHDLPRCSNTCLAITLVF